MRGDRFLSLQRKPHMIVRFFNPPQSINRHCVADSEDKTSLRSKTLSTVAVCLLRRSVHHISDFSRQAEGGEWLLDEGIGGFDNPVQQDGVVCVATHEQDL